MPERFGSVEDARTQMRALLGWHITAHYHAALSLLTPADVHHKCAGAIVEARQRILDAAHATIQKQPPAIAWINPPLDWVERKEPSAH